MTWHAFSGAVALIWFGMVLAISFLEAPLKFRAPGITVQLGLGIGQLVFRALNMCEVVLAALVAVGLVAGHGGAAGAGLLTAAVVVLAVQLLVVRPALRARSRKVLAQGSSGKRSKQHLWYVAFEVVKAILLVAGGFTALAGQMGA